MTLVGVALGIAAVLIVASIAYVGRRDRGRLSSADDSAAHRRATTEAGRYAAEAQVRNPDTGAGW
ncbi:hypothetical protein [Micromonospora sp. NPDC004704]